MRLFGVTVLSPYKPKTLSVADADLLKGRYIKLFSFGISSFGASTTVNLEFNFPIGNLLFVAPSLSLTIISPEVVIILPLGAGVSNNHVVPLVGVELVLELAKRRKV